VPGGFFLRGVELSNQSESLSGSPSAVTIW
jgi:hypothetical protein